MKLRRLLTREGRMQASTERDEAKLSARLAELDAGIAAGEGDVLALMEEREAVARQLKAAAITRQRAEQREHQRKNEERSADFRARREEAAKRLGRALAEALWESTAMAQLEAEYVAAGIGEDDWEAATGLPYGFAGNFPRAVRALAPRMELDYGFLSGKEPGRPTAKPPEPVAIPVPPQTDLNGVPLHRPRTYV